MHAERLLLVSMLLASGCATFDDHMRAGRYAKACVMAREDSKLRARFDAWAREHASASAELVPQEEVESALGGPLAEYGVRLGVYRLQVSVPGARTDSILVDSEPDARELVRALPPLVLPTEPLLPPGPVDPKDFEASPLPREEPEPETRSGFFGGFVGALVGAAFEVGRVVGGVVAMPVALSVGMAVGSVEVVTNVATWALGGTPDHPLLAPHTLVSAESAPPPFEVPVYLQKPATAAGSTDALLFEHEHRALSAARTATWESQKAVVLEEHARRVRLAGEVNTVLQTCNRPECRRVLPPGKTTIRTTHTFLDGNDACLGPSVDQEVQLPQNASPRPAWVKPAPLSPVTVLDQDAPPWALSLPATTPLPWKSAAASLGIVNLLCRVTLAKGAVGNPRSTSLSVRVTVGREEPRVQRWLLGPTPRSATFLAPGVNVQAGERVRLTFADEGAHRHLGGGMVEFTGSLPLLIRNGATETRCTEAPADALQKSLGVMEERFTAAAAHLATAVEQGQAEDVARDRKAAREALLGMALHAGWHHERVLAARELMARVDPAERPAR